MFKTVLVIVFVIVTPLLGVRAQYTQSHINRSDQEDSIIVCVDGYEATKCDGVAECPDGADEEPSTCHDIVCRTDEFRCRYGGCVPQKKVCDGRRDCRDGTDELEPYCRKARNFVCANELDIASNWAICDGRMGSCPDGSDETQELCANASCHSNQFKCLYGACLYYGAACDGVPDCIDRSDETEAACGKTQCKRNEFRCAYGVCVSEDRICYRGGGACLDGSDRRHYCGQGAISGNFRCNYGKLIPIWQVCNGMKNCEDYSDETAALCKDVLCHSNQFRCNYGGCLFHGAACDGFVDCIDGSDETEDTCGRNNCGEGQFRCGYGACISADLVCDGRPHCVDRSDEDPLLCQNKTCSGRMDFHCGYGACLKQTPCFWLNGVVSYSPCNEHRVIPTFFRCQNGQRILPVNMCNTIYDCADKSDEADILCSNVKRTGCQYGECNFLFPRFACDGQIDCLDGSDESKEMCHNLRCVVPAPPEHGRIRSGQSTTPGDVVESLTLTIICDDGYTVNSTTDEVICNQGVWSVYPLPNCVRYCTLESNPSVSYRCVDAGAAAEDSRACRPRELAGARALPACGGPAGPALAVPYMTCGADGAWDRTPNCTTVCGLVTPVGGVTLLAGGIPAEFGELPWHAGIYEKTKKHYSHIGAGSLVKENLVISAAHCFWAYSLTEGKYIQRPAEEFAVAVGKTYRRWKHKLDRDAQWSDVSKIILPQDFEGSNKYYQADIALVFVANAFEYKTHIRPVCLNFDPVLDEQQLTVGRKGKVAGWGLTSANGTKSNILTVVEMPYVDSELCNQRYPSNFKQYLGLDKFCAGFYEEGIALCMGDSGGGLAFPEIIDGEQRYFLRGIASVSPITDSKCNVNFYTTLTRVVKHEGFITQNF